LCTHREKTVNKENQGEKYGAVSALPGNEKGRPHRSCINQGKPNMKSSPKEITIMDNKETEKKKQLVEEECKPLTDEEFKEYQEKDARTTNKVLRFFKAIWEAVNFFGT
jgi:hypothetical protein